MVFVFYFLLYILPFTYNTYKMSLKSTLDSLILEGSKHFALGQYELAVQSFGSACELHPKLHGNDSPSLLFLYGRALYQVAVAKSDVLGKGKDQDEKDEEEEKEKDEKDEKFQFDEPEVQEQQEKEEDEEEQGDLEIAWDVLDTSRALFLQKIEKIKAKSESDAKSESESDPKNKEKTLVDLEKGLAETFDVLGEVSLENENFSQAASDFKSSLELKEKHYPKDSSLVSEAHFKLALAYEFCVDEETEEKEETFKELAIHHLQKAVEIVKKQKDPDSTILKDLQEKLDDLKSQVAQDKLLFQINKEKVLRELVGEKAEKVQSEVKGVNDLSGLVKKKKRGPESEAPNKKAKH